MLSLWANWLVTKFGLNSLKRYLWPVLYEAHRKLKGLSHWRRRCRDWSVAATRAIRETTKWLALSPRRRLRDVSRGDNQFPRSRGSRSDVSETSSQLRRRLRQLQPYLIGLETRWRLESPLVAEMSPRRLLETSRVSGESREIQTRRLRDLLETSPQHLLGLQQVLETSRGRLRRDLLETGKSL